jgi:hypothetical protein
MIPVHTQCTALCACLVSSAVHRRRCINGTIQSCRVSHWSTCWFMAAVANIVPYVIGLLSEVMHSVDIDPNKLIDGSYNFLSFRVSHWSMCWAFSRRRQYCACLVSSAVHWRRCINGTIQSCRVSHWSTCWLIAVVANIVPCVSQRS